MSITLHHGDIPAALDFGGSVAVDTETMGLNPARDALCVVQLSAGDGTSHVVKLRRPDYEAPNLRRLLGNPAVLKIFHYARFDLGMIKRYLGVDAAPVYCTKLASKLARTYTDKHGLKDLVKEILNIDLSKQQQSSDWGAESLSEAQLAYAASDVLHLHALKASLDKILIREGRMALAESSFAFLPVRAALDLAGFEELDIFAH